MLEYQEHVFPSDAEPDPRRRIETALRLHPERTRSALDGWIGRRSEIDGASVQVEAVHPDGSLDLAFTETSWMACRLETGTEPHHHRVRYRLEEGRVVLLTLPREAFEDRVDEI